MRFVSIFGRFNVERTFITGGQHNIGLGNWGRQKSIIEGTECI